MTQEEIKDEVDRLIRALSSGQDPLDIAVNTLSQMGDDPHEFKTWVSEFVRQGGAVKFPEFHARVVQEQAFKAQNHLMNMQREPPPPADGEKPDVVEWHVLRVSFYHLTPETRMSMVSTPTGILSVNPVIGADKLGGGRWLFDIDKEARKVLKAGTAPDLVPILQMAVDLGCTHVMVSRIGTLTPGLPTWLP